MPESIEIEARGDNYVIVRTSPAGEVTELLLAPESVIKLAQNARRLTDHILAQLSRPGAESVVLTPVSRLSLNCDLHKTTIHLGLIDQDGVEAMYGLPLEVAKPLAENLPRWVGELEAAIPSQTKQ